MPDQETPAARYRRLADECRRFAKTLSSPNARKTRSTILAYVIAAIGLIMLLYGVWGFIVLKNAEIDVALTDEAIVLGLMGGGLATIGVAQALRLLLILVRNSNHR
jgi:hypothetical protein